MPPIKSPFWFWISVTWAVINFLAGFAGLIDGLIEWRDTARPMVELYLSFRTWLSTLVPRLILSPYIVDYLVIGNSVWIVVGLFSGELRPFKNPIDFLLTIIFWPAILIWAIRMLFGERGPITYRDLETGEEGEMSGEFEIGAVFFFLLGIVYGIGLLLLFIMVDLCRTGLTTLTC